MNPILPLLDGHNPYFRFLILVIAAWLLYFFCRFFIIRVVKGMIKNIPQNWAVIFNLKLMSLVSWLLPILLVHSGTKIITDLPWPLQQGIHKLTLVFIVLITIRAISISLEKVNEVYNSLEVSRNRPIKGIIQVTKIITYLFAFILVFAIVLDESPWFLLSGLGAMTAVLLLIFRDTILSLVAGVQLTSNNLIQMGDWIEMPQFGADGDVVDIALHSVRVQNWDKTITVIPTHKFLENSFKNWRGMQQSGGRRIKRSLNIDMNSIRFLTEDEIIKLSQFSLLKKYLNEKKKELEEYNQKLNADPNLNGRRLTNVGTFRAYLKNYLSEHPMVNQNMTLMVRQLAPAENGLPIEVYIFTKDTRWVVYEQAQADIFDHIIAISSAFDLRIHQNPTGFDFRELRSPS